MAEAQLLENQDTQAASREEFSDNGTWKNFQNSLLCATTYQLNYSGTKKAFVGLTYDETLKKYKPTIQLKNSYYSRGLDFEINTWEEIQHKLQDISRYFNSSSPNLCIQQQERIKLSKIDIILTTSYGMKSVMFCQHTPEPDTEDSPYIPKKKRAVAPSITMQKRTFEGLKSVIVCINERSRRLERVLSEINECKDSLMDVLEKRLTLYHYENVNTEQTVKNLIFEERHSIKEKLLQTFNPQDSVFIQHYFDIVFLEMIILHHHIFHDEIYNRFCAYNAQKI